MQLLGEIARELARPELAARPRYDPDGRKGKRRGGRLQAERLPPARPRSAQRPRTRPRNGILTRLVLDPIVGQEFSRYGMVNFARSNSRDGQHPTRWVAVNDGQPVLESTKGMHAVRDPAIVRSPEGDGST